VRVSAQARGRRVCGTRPDDQHRNVQRQHQKDRRVPAPLKPSVNPAPIAPIRLKTGVPRAKDRASTPSTS